VNYPQRGRLILLSESTTTMTAVPMMPPVERNMPRIPR